MRTLALISAVVLSFSSGIAFAQSNGTNVQVKPGHFCASNKCVRFSRDLQSVSIQSRRPVSVTSYGLGQNPTISSETFREIFYLALRQTNAGTNR
jgi:hypothetical protein